ncbi:ATP-binding protein [Hymenobacter qilianensis]|uniref:ATP-binding protein n=1 Tax=Hymenobacter qilianensis TaxID=1385715 RepID=UPI0037444052
MQDTGIGIPGKLHTHLFDKFNPTRRKGLHGEPTTGLGLFIAKQIVQLHGATSGWKAASSRAPPSLSSCPKEGSLLPGFLPLAVLSRRMSPRREAGQRGVSGRKKWCRRRRSCAPPRARPHSLPSS